MGRALRNAPVRVVAVLALAAPAAALASGSSQVRVTNCFSEQFEPKQIIIACGDAGQVLNKLSWSSWSTSEASGNGDLVVKKCLPDCATGGTVSFPVKVALSKPVSCTKHKYKVFKEVKLTYTGKLPAHTKRTQTLTLGHNGCPL